MCLYCSNLSFIESLGFQLMWTYFYFLLACTLVVTLLFLKYIAFICIYVAFNLQSSSSKSYQLFIFISLFVCYFVFSSDWKPISATYFEDNAVNNSCIFVSIITPWVPCGCCILFIPMSFLTLMSHRISLLLRISVYCTIIVLHHL